jgi:type II secretory ATPase GspE/PulE/Tfp pilus assembly ATPase PilB-like protein
MEMNNEIRELVLKNSSSGQIREAAIRNGLRSLSDDGWRLIGQGVTTVEEVMRVTKDQTLSIAKNGHGAASEAIVAK